ncbi:MAG: type II toxin-antitoxin system VapC family toxin [Cyclobacteriaceae bacterium]
MIGIDTNVLVRYIVQDHQVQSKKATEFIESLTPKTSGFISSIVLCELNWVLKSAYGIDKNKRIAVIDTILSTSVFEIEDMTASMKALRSYENGKADYSDYLIREVMLDAGCETIMTFDKAALLDKGFKSP